MKKLSYLQNLNLAFAYITKFRRIKNFPYLSEQQCRKYQFEKIKKLLNIAYYHTDFYRTKYDKAGIKPEDIRSLADFTRVPSLTKQELIKYNELFIDKRVNRNNLICSRTSGSSGQFVNLFLSPGMFIEEELQVLRMLKQYNKNFGAKDREALVYTSEYPVKSILGCYPVYYINNLLPVGQILQKLIKIKPKIIAIYPSILREIINTAEQSLFDLGIETIITNSEGSTQKERDYFADVFHCDVFDEFSSEELQSVFLQCEHKNYHDVTDCTYIELLKETSDEAVEVGESGEIVGTCLINTSMPIIRYRSGDFARESEKKCACGQHGRIFEDIIGRKNSSLRKEDGTVIPSGKVLDWTYSLVLEHNLDIKEFQIIQKTLHEIDVMLVVGKGYHTITDNKFFMDNFKLHFGEDFFLDISILDKIPKTQAGKHIPIISYVV